MLIRVGKKNCPGKQDTYKLSLFCDDYLNHVMFCVLKDANLAFRLLVAISWTGS